MKAIINSKEYDTEAAKLIGSRGIGQGNGYFYIANERLYCDSAGEYFLCGLDNGPYDSSVHFQGLGPGEHIVPVTKDAARARAIKYQEEDACSFIHWDDED